MGRTRPGELGAEYVVCKERAESYMIEVCGKDAHYGSDRAGTLIEPQDVEEQSQHGKRTMYWLE